MPKKNKIHTKALSAQNEKNTLKQLLECINRGNSKNFRTHLKEMAAKGMDATKLLTEKSFQLAQKKPAATQMKQETQMELCFQYVEHWTLLSIRDF